MTEYDREVVFLLNILENRLVVPNIIINKFIMAAEFKRE